jgi:hypothetical protein
MVAAAHADNVMTHNEPARSLAVQRRRESRRDEFRIQERLTHLLNRHLDPATSFWCSLENRPLSMLSGLYGRRRGIVAGMPDLVVIQARGDGLVRVACVELKSRAGVASQSQKEVRDRMLSVGIAWWLARSPRAALAALRRSDIAFRREWKEPQLAKWEGPFENPHARLPQHPRVAAERAAARKRWRERQRIRDAAQRAAAARYEGAQTPDGPSPAVVRAD